MLSVKTFGFKSNTNILLVMLLVRMLLASIEGPGGGLLRGLGDLEAP